MFAASILCSNWAKLGNEAQKAINAGFSSLHIDIMDYSYVPNLSFGPEILKFLRQILPKAQFDVHLMSRYLDQLVPRSLAFGADRIIIHPEASSDLDSLLGQIDDSGKKIGLAFNPESDLSLLKSIGERVDQVILMGVSPGFGGQRFQNSVLTTIVDLVSIRNRMKHSYSISIDGGVNDANINQIGKFGAEHFVIGSYLFRKTDYCDAYKILRDHLHQEAQMVKS